MTIMQQKRGTASELTTANPILASGEIGFETDTNRFKIGNGVDTWTVLPYAALLNIVEDLTPQLGGDLDTNGFDITNINALTFDTTPTGIPTGTGVLSWNEVDKTLDLQSEGVTYQLGQELVQNVKRFNNSGLVNGKVVYTVGSSGTNILVDYALATGDPTSSNTFGVMTASASGGSHAPATTFGLVRNIDTSALTEGATVWLSGTVAGAMTTTKPAAPIHTVKIGICIRSHATEGVVFVNIQNGFELDELHDVLITSPESGHVIQRNGSNLWVNKSLADAGISAIGHTHAFADISSKPTTLSGYGITDAAPIASPALTGVPTAPTAVVDTNTTQLATTAYVIGQGYLKSATAASTYAPLAFPSFTGDITSAGDINLNGGDLLTTSTTASLFNTTATTLNIGGAATTINMGKATGTVNILDTVNFAGGYDIANGVTISSTGDISANGYLRADDYIELKNSSGTGIKISTSQTLTGSLPGILFSPFIDGVESGTKQLYYAHNLERWVVESDFRTVGNTVMDGTLSVAGGFGSSGLDIISDGSIVMDGSISVGGGYSAGGINLASTGSISASGTIYLNGSVYGAGTTTTTGWQTLDGYIASSAGTLFATNTDGIALGLSRQTSNGNVAQFYRGSSTLVGSISVTTTATAYNTSSDYRLKENVVPIVDGISRIMLIKPSRFNFIIEPDYTVDGFLAHEIAEVVPEVVTGEKDAIDDNGDPIYQAIDQSKLVPLLTAALQEAIKKIVDLEDRVSILENR